MYNITLNSFESKQYITYDSMNVNLKLLYDLYEIE